MFSLAGLNPLVGEISLFYLAKLVLVICYALLGCLFFWYGEDGMFLQTRWTLSFKTSEAFRFVLVGNKFYFIWRIWNSSVWWRNFLYCEAEIFCVAKMVINLTCTFINWVWWCVAFFRLVLVISSQIFIPYRDKILFHPEFLTSLSKHIVVLKPNLIQFLVSYLKDYIFLSRSWTLRSVRRWESNSKNLWSNPQILFLSS